MAPRGARQEGSASAGRLAPAQAASHCAAGMAAVGLPARLLVAAPPRAPAVLPERCAVPPGGHQAKPGGTKMLDVDVPCKPTSLARASPLTRAQLFTRGRAHTLDCAGWQALTRQSMRQRAVILVEQAQQRASRTSPGHMQPDSDDESGDQLLEDSSLHPAGAGAPVTPMQEEEVRAAQTLSGALGTAQQPGATVQPSLSRRPSSAKVQGMEGAQEPAAAQWLQRETHEQSVGRQQGLLRSDPIRDRQFGPSQQVPYVEAGQAPDAISQQGSPDRDSAGYAPLLDPASSAEAGVAHQLLPAGSIQLRAGSKAAGRDVGGPASSGFTSGPEAAQQHIDTRPVHGGCRC